MASSPRRSLEDRIRPLLLEFYDHRRRPLPWRTDADPYRVWVSEVMLQQTRVDVVIPYYERWMERFPSLASLAAAELDEVLAAWAGLGYYRRARNLHAAARLVVETMDGKLPDTARGLRTLPGIGPYTAGAVASIAFDRAEPAVDGNVRRVLARLYDLEEPAPAALRSLARTLVCERRPGDSNQALMELGATICTPRAPDCPDCPLEEACLARRRGTVDERPRPRGRAAVPRHRIATAAIVSSEGRALLTRRPTSGLLGGTWEFPGAEVDSGEPPGAAALRAACSALDRTLATDPVSLGTFDHAFSHRRHAYHAFLLRIDEETPFACRPGGSASNWTAAAWVLRDQRDGYALSAAQRRIARALDYTLDRTPC